MQDFHNCSFHSDVQIGRAYWSSFAARRGISDQVEPRLSLAAFKRTLKKGDRLKLLAAPKGRTTGAIRTITAVRSSDLILDGSIYLNLPRAADFACDGRLVRIAIGHEHEPDAHLLYEWMPAGSS